MEKDLTGEIATYLQATTGWDVEMIKFAINDYKALSEEENANFEVCEQDFGEAVSSYSDEDVISWFNGQNFIEKNQSIEDMRDNLLTSMLTIYELVYEYMLENEK